MKEEKQLMQSNFRLAEFEDRDSIIELLNKVTLDLHKKVSINGIILGR
ncbi:hypothetical protein GOQ27_03465 [Clostridium sp. D2Q-11]|uniref:Uncharacterized protein n=1 Tax=Anaeromonas frigoriresistens TaxID=2683708 RepID=A0A942Z819_9FIRM|nr:hypothetical protein [Anaeromonas frigoriresistens]MBS4537504.1 hypothetical protein [Anaeromonas frigoriresistens]